MTFQQMQYFIETANCRSFSKAAQNLHISQPNLTKYIANMEKELGIKLFDRNTHKVELTDDGRRLLQKTETLYTSLSRAIEEVRLSSAANQKITPIEIGINQDEEVPPEFMQLLYRLNTQPDVSYRYELLQDSHAGLISHLREHQYDMVISTDKNLCRSAGLTYIAARPFELLLAIHKDHPLADREDLHPCMLQNLPIYFSLPEGKDASQQAVDSLYTYIGTVPVVILQDSPSDLLLNVEAGAGAALVSSLIDQSSYPHVRFHHFERLSSQMQRIAWHSEDTNPGLLQLIAQLKELYPENSFYTT